jgi:hypothetical protein
LHHYVARTARATIAFAHAGRTTTIAIVGAIAGTAFAASIADLAIRQQWRRIIAGPCPVAKSRRACFGNGLRRTCSRRARIAFARTRNVAALAIISTDIRGAGARPTTRSTEGAARVGIARASRTHAVAAVTAQPFVGGR